ncbi:IS66 family insertion sequence element accessory protein TnpB [Pseudomonas sessilinigenes]|uniref:IS66 family insertion sequence element accessory protein TnpB n=1 Tax=Pseudomonas sessilinigenes TaxID=658629 RepID=UPI001CEC45C7
MLFVFLNRPHNQVKILYWKLNGFCLWPKHLESEQFNNRPTPRTRRLPSASKN